MFSRIITPLNLGLLALLLFAGTWLTAPLFASEMARPQRSGMVQVINLTATPSPTATPANTAPTYLTQWGSTGSGNGQFSSPVSVAADSSGNLYVTESTNNRVQKFTSDGVYLTQWGSLSIPFGIAVDSSDNVYVAEYNGSRITKFTSNGIYLTQWGTYGTGNGQFVGPNDVAVDSNGYVYVVDRHNNRIQKFDSNGTYLAQWGSSGNGNGQFSEPWGLAVDGSNNVYVADRGNSRIQKFTSNGAFLLKWGIFGNSNGQFVFPRDLGADSAGNLYVTDEGNHRVQKFTNSGLYLTQFGTNGSANGQFNLPWGVTVGGSNAVYVVDSSNNRLQKFGQVLPLTPTATPTPTTNPNAVVVALPTAATSAPGTHVTIPVTVGNTTGKGIISYDFRFDFDPTVLSFTGLNSAGTLSAGWTATPASDSAIGAVFVTAFSAAPMTGSGTLINLVFEVVGTVNSATALTWNSFIFNEGEPSATTTNGIFTVSGGGATPTLTPTPTPTTNPNAAAVTLPTAATGTPGGMVTVPVQLSAAVTGQGIVAYEFRLTFDPAVLTPANVTTAGTLSDGWNLTVNTNTPGALQVVAFNTTPLVGSGTLLNLLFNVVGPRGTSTALTWTNFVFNEGEPAAQTSDGFFAGVPVPVTLPTAATGATGTQVNIPVLLPETVDGLAIIAYEFSLAFDPAVLSVAGATTNGTLSNGWNISINSGTPGIAQVVAFNVAPLAGSGTLLNLVFNVTGAANSSTALTWTNFIFNEGAPMAQTSAGSFRVLAWQLGGAITYRTTPRAMGGVTLNLSGATANATTTNASGLYSFTIESEGAHTVTPSKSGAINGISAFDAAFVAQCVAGLRNLADCPLLAADTSGNNLLSAFDAAQIAQYAAGLAGPTSRVGRWVFSPASRTYATLTSNLTTENYGAYLVGEVSGNWQPPSVSVAAQTGDNPASGVMLVGGAGGTVTVQHDGGVADLLAYQITLHYDASLGTLVEVIPAAVSAAAGWELVANMRTPGVVTLVGYGATPLTGAGSLATLRFIAVDGQAMSLSPTIVAVQRNEAALWFTQELRYRHFLPWVGAE